MFRFSSCFSLMGLNIQLCEQYEALDCKWTLPQDVGISALQFGQFGWQPSLARVSNHSLRHFL